MGLLPDYSVKDKLWLVVMRRWKPALIVFITISIAGIVATHNLKPIYEAKTQLKFKNTNFNSLLKETTSTNTDLVPGKEQEDSVITELELLRSLPLIQKTISELQLKNKQGELLTPEQLQEKLQVKQLDNTEIIEVSYQASQQKVAAQVVKSLVDNYINQNISNDLAELASSKDFLNNQLDETEDALAQIEQSILKIKEDSQIIELQAAAVSLTQTLEEISKQIILNRSELAKLKNESQFIAGKLRMNSEQALMTVKVNQSLAVQNLTEQLQELELQLIREKNNAIGEDSRVDEISQEIKHKQDLRQKQISQIAGDQEVMLFVNSDLNIIQNLTLELVKLEASNTGLTRQIEYLVAMQQEKSQQANLIPELELQLRQLDQELNNSRDTYNLLLKDINKVEVAENQNLSNIRVISSEIIAKRATDFYFTYYLASLCLGILAAMASIVILEITDRSLKTEVEAQKIFGHSWLGIIPAITSVPAPLIAKSGTSAIANNLQQNPETKINPNKIPFLIVQAEPISNASESYRILYSNLKFSCSQNRIRTIVITSCTAQEGKSSIAANLAHIMAQKGENVLLIDANFHSPIQHKVWNVYHNIGISNLIGERFAPQSIIQRARPNLDIISAGETDSPTPILDSPRMQSFLANYSNIYDFILIDSPALDANADAITLGNIADGMLLVVQSGKLNRSQAKFAKELLNKSGQNVFGLVFNKFNSVVKNHRNQSRFLGNLETNQEQLVDVEQSEANLWDIMSHYPRELNKNKLILGLDSEELDKISLAELEKQLTYLAQDLEKLTQIVKEQEDEFFLQGQIVRKLQKQANLSSIQEKIDIEQQLGEQQEVKNLLGETLLGQRRNLNQKREIFNQYQKLLSTKKNSEVQLNGSNEH
ncbi:capsular exopolysaccharide biosynthesis protein [Xenococcus sp. PCC 7305]|uniref:GumC family protein n=1 Tax=Xenococcus sp. PCC 7305 TaxID=102125 RepID=UPI0002ABD34F|nr:polysaccharide biosynthesis tyrosine autokinase [Xenococcus sp. PCC 7305]ELS05514.1 capsular exopolysaccharide biosynthesis protein [Xenococcus sp. PCC 7305]